MKLTVREVVAVLRRMESMADTCVGCDGSGEQPRRNNEACRECGGIGEKLSSPQAELAEIRALLARWDAEVEAEEREEHRRAIEAAESEAVEPW